MLDPKIITKYKKLIFVFFTTFIVVLLASTHIATMLTPEIDIPVLNNNEEVSDISSEDFKTRIDSRLKLIAIQDKDNAKKDPASNYTQPEKKEIKHLSAITFKSKNEKEEKIVEDDNKEEVFNNLEPEKILIRKKGEPPLTPPVITSVNSNLGPQNLPVKKTEVADSSSNNASVVPMRPPIPIRQKIEVQPKKIQMIKVLVGNYNNADDARSASSKLAQTMDNITPFIKKYEGSYAVQVGSFTNPVTASLLIQELKSKNYYVRVAQE